MTCANENSHIQASELTSCPAEYYMEHLLWGQEAAVASSTKEGCLLTYKYFQVFLQIKSNLSLLLKCPQVGSLELEL